MDVTLLRLHYSIFNTSFKELASLSDLPASLIQDEAEREGWFQFWPTKRSLSQRVKSQANAKLLEASEVIDNESGNLESDSDFEAVEANPIASFVEEQSLRLQAFEIAKSIYLANRYLVAECEIIKKIYDTVGEIEATDADAPTKLRHAATALSILTGSSTAKQLISKSKSADDGKGLPLLVIKDLTGDAANA